MARAVPSAAPSPIGDYAIIGDGSSAALVSRTGSIDWLCWPRFDSPSQLAALLDERAGHFRLWVEDARIERRYRPDTAVLETRFITEGGELVVTDLMPVSSAEERGRMLEPEHEILRLVRCERGAVDLRLELAVRPRYGEGRARLRHAGALGIRVETPDGLLVLRSDLPLGIGEDGVVRGQTRLAAGQTACASLVYAGDGPAVLPPLGARAHEAVERTVRWWQDWSSRVWYAGPWREAVVRSALSLRLLLYAPSGAIVAAPTTSLPERPGGSYNWDYRYCWLRDASLTVHALYGLGFAEEADSFVSWLLHTTRLTRPALRVLYDVYGRPAPPERVLGHLAGHRGARPVRIGNGARDQIQLDVYGEVLDAATQLVRRRGGLDRDTRNLLSDLGEYVLAHWREPDAGIWESRGPRRARTHSLVMCWTALDRLLMLRAAGHLERPRAVDLASAREQIRRTVLARAYDPARQSYSAVLGGESVDASLLLLARVGFEPASSERMRGTWRRIQAELGAPGGVYYRNRDPETAGEGAFAACGFWAAEFLASGGGELEDALGVFESQLQFANDVGLFAEEMDPWSGAALGNVPQAFSHVGLINAALTLTRRIEQHQWLGHRRRTFEWPPVEMEAHQ